MTFGAKCARSGCESPVLSYTASARFCSMVCQQRRNRPVQADRLCERSGCLRPVVGLRSDARYCSAKCRASHAMRRYNYGLTDEQFNIQIEAQGGVCAICQREPQLPDRPWSVDHDHACCDGRRSCGKCNRGLLCVPCNSAIGLLQDNSSLLRQAAIYLESGGVWIARP